MDADAKELMQWAAYLGVGSETRLIDGTTAAATGIARIRHLKAARSRRST